MNEYRQSIRDALVVIGAVCWILTILIRGVNLASIRENT